MLNLADNDDLMLEALALRTAGPAGRIHIEVPDQLAAGTNTSGRQLADFLATLLGAREDETESRGCQSDTSRAVRTAPAVLVLVASHIAWRRFRETMSVFEGVTVEMPAST